MSMNVKINAALLSSLLAVVLAAGTAAVGYGWHSAKIDSNAEGIRRLEKSRGHDMTAIRTELREMNRRLDNYFQGETR